MEFAVSEVWICGVEGVGFLAEVDENAVGVQQLEGREAEVVHDDEPVELADEVSGKSFHSVALNEHT